MVIWQPEFTDKTLSRKIGAVQFQEISHPGSGWWWINCMRRSIRR
ncbi:phage tail protein [Klebsiella michiganensis]|nr:phage tail protein [Klebsiella michiganensis]